MAIQDNMDETTCFNYTALSNKDFSHFICFDGQ